MTASRIVSLNKVGCLGKDLQFPGMHDRSGHISDLMERFINEDDGSAFESLFNTMYVPLCLFCQRVVRVREVAEELVSDVFYTLWKNRDRMEVTSHRSYLFTAVRNRGLDYLRKTKRGVLCELQAASHVPVDIPDSQEMLVGIELSHSIQKSIDALPAQRRRIFLLSRDQGLKYKEIALELNISVKTVETQMGRALRHLLEQVMKDGGR